MLHNKTPPYRAIVVGLGQIGQGYDYDRDNKLFVMTHASAYSQHPLFELVGGVDTNSQSRQLFERKYRRPSFETVAGAMQALSPVIASVATPTACHLDTFKALAPYKLRAIVLEKPIAGDVTQAKMIAELADNYGIALLVNYVRRYEPGTQQLRKMLSDNLIGKVYKGVVCYGKGFMHSGSHFIDLLSYLLGEATLVSTISTGRSFTISGVKDYEPDLVMSFGGTPTIFLSIRHEYFMHHEVQLFGENGIVHYGAGEIKYRLVEQNSERLGFRALSQQHEFVNADFNRYQYHVMTALGNALQECKEQERFDSQDALKILNLFGEIYD